MILKIILAIVAITLIYKFLGGRFPQIRSKDKPLKQIEEDTLVECEACGTFVTLKESITTKGKTYCSSSCAGL